METPAGDALTRLEGILEGAYNLLSIRVPRRYLLSLLVVAAVKLTMAAFIYLSTGVASTTTFWMDPTRVEPLPQNQILLEAGVPRWVFLFVGWDGAWYASIASGGYALSGQSFAFMPGLPLLTRLLVAVMKGPLPAIAVSSLVVGLLWVPLYESVAEHYVGKRSAFLGTLLFALSPFTLLFTTVAYSEGLFLLLSLVTWRLYLDKRYFVASIAAAFVAMVRVPGLLLLIPIVFGLFRGGRRLVAALVCVPTALALLLWAGFMWSGAGDPLAIVHASEWSGMYTLPTFLAKVLPGGGIGSLSLPVPYLDVYWLLPAAVWASLMLSLFLLWRLRGIDEGLLVYSLVYVAGVLAFGALVSLPRYLAALFPIWLPLSSMATRRLVLPVVIVGSIIVCLMLWAGFVGGLFVG